MAAPGPARTAPTTISFREAFAESGILVASLDFRMPPEAPYPASLADINLGIRWLKARARTYGSRPDWVGVFGTSSGGHQVLLAAMRPDNPDYAALPLAEAPQIDARVAFVISGWGVLDPLLALSPREEGRQCRAGRKSSRVLA